MLRLFIATACFLLPAWPAHAYVDLAPTLSRIIRESQTITVAEVVAFNPEKGVVVLKKVRDLKGESTAQTYKHNLIRTNDAAVDRQLLEWVEPGRRCVIFVTGKAAIVCVGEVWYQAYAADENWWRISVPRPELPLAYYGTMSRLIEAIPLILAGKSAVITALPHGANREGASFDLALNRSNLPGLVKVQRLRASTKMPEMAMGVGSNPAFVIGMGRVGREELPALRAKLNSADATVRAESAIDLGFLGSIEAEIDLAKLLDDDSPNVRLAGASALLRIKSKGAGKRSLDILAKGLASEDVVIRRHAAGAVSLAGARAAPLAGKLGAMLSDPDALVRRSALQAIATLGPAAAEAVDPVAALLGNRATAIDAADALGRMGPKAQPALKAIAPLLTADAHGERWAAVRAMAQIGGPDALPAVKFMMRELPKASEIDGYNMLIYLSLLGPVAKDAIPFVQKAPVRNPILRLTTVWAIDSSTDLPIVGPFGDAEFAQYILESYVRELGDHLKPAAQVLAKKIMAGKAGNVPPWGYKLLAKFPEESLAILTPGLARDELVMRERATVAIGYMGRAAAAVRPQVAQALKTSPDEREQRLLRWCLRELE
jgi:hypothetical protein